MFDIGTIVIEGEIEKLLNNEGIRKVLLGDKFIGSDHLYR